MQVRCNECNALLKIEVIQEPETPFKPYELAWCPICEGDLHEEQQPPTSETTETT